MSRPLLDHLSRPVTWRRLILLVGLLVWQCLSTDPLSLHGRGLIILGLLVIAAAAWIPWSLSDPDTLLGRGLGWDSFVMAAAGGLMVGASPSGASNVFMFAAAFTAGVRAGMPRAFAVTLVAIISLAAGWIAYQSGVLGAVAYSLGLLATTFGGAQRHDALQRREQAELLLAQTQRSHEEALRNATLEESSRIAREIHDVLAHSLAGLSIQLEATVALIEGGADAEAVLPRVRRAHALAREGLRETRLAVGALRGEEGAAAPAGSRIDALISDFRGSGGTIESHLDGARERLGGPAGEAAVRIVQEALTNVTKHAPGAPVTVSLSAGPPLTVTVENGPPTAGTISTLSDAGGGYGIAGMRERVQQLGGRLSAGPTATGWAVRAELEAGGP